MQRRARCGREVAMLAKLTKGKGRTTRDVVSLYIKQLSLVGVPRQARGEPSREGFSGRKNRGDDETS